MKSAPPSSQIFFPSDRERKHGGSCESVTAVTLVIFAPIDAECEDEHCMYILVHTKKEEERLTVGVSPLSTVSIVLSPSLNASIDSIEFIFLFKL